MNREPSHVECACGCGKPTPIARQTDRKRRYVRGEPVRFAMGHGPRGTPAEQEARRYGRFWSKVEVRGPDECWPWTGCIQSNGYGRFGWGPGTIGAHVALVRLSGTPLPAGHEADHTCFVRHCCNPWHVEVVTGAVNRQRENQRRWAR